MAAANKRSKCLITLFAILPSNDAHREEILQIFDDLSNNNKTSMHLQKDVYLPENSKDELFGSLMAVCDLKQKQKHGQKHEKIREDAYWHLEISGKEILYHKHECLIRNVDFIPISSNFESLLMYLGHKHAFSFIQKGTKYYVPHYDITIYVYSLQQVLEKQSKIPVESNKQIIEMCIEHKSGKNEQTEQKLLNFSKIFDHLHFFKIQPSSCKKIV